MASSGGCPKPSYSDGKTSAEARRYSVASSSSETRPRCSTPSGSGAIEASTGEHEAKLRSLAAHELHRLEQPAVVLVWPGSRRVEHERLGRFIDRPESLVVDSGPHDSNALRVETKMHGGAIACEVAEHDHSCRTTSPPVVRDRAVGPRRTREVRGQIPVLDVVQRHDRRHARRRQLDGEGIVDDATTVERTACRRSGCQQELERSSTRKLDHTRIVAVRYLRGCTGHRDAVGELADPAQTAYELARIDLAAADLSRRERQQRQADDVYARQPPVSPL